MRQNSILEQISYRNVEGFLAGLVPGGGGYILALAMHGAGSLNEVSNGYLAATACAAMKCYLHDGSLGKAVLSVGGAALSVSIANKIYNTHFNTPPYIQKFIPMLRFMEGALLAKYFLPSVLLASHNFDNDFFTGAGHLVGLISYAHLCPATFSMEQNSAIKFIASSTEIMDAPFFDYPNIQPLSINSSASIAIIVAIPVAISAALIAAMAEAPAIAAARTSSALSAVWASSSAAALAFATAYMATNVVITEGMPAGLERTGLVVVGGQILARPIMASVAQVYEWRGGEEYIHPAIAIPIEYQRGEPVNQPAPVQVAIAR